MKQCHRMGVILWLLATSAFAETVIINRPLSDQDVRYQYPELLLKKVLEITEPAYGSAQVVRSATVMTRDRTLYALIEGKLIDVMAEAPKPEWERELLPVRIPIRKGIQGLRLFFVMKDSQPLLADLKDFDEFRQLPTGSGAQWSTARVMREAGFDVVTSNNYESLFTMLSEGRFITFGRGINEIYSEFYRHVSRFPDLRVDESVVLYIPLPTYFFVTPRKPHLAQRIEEGLRMMIASGSFDEFFCQYHSRDIEEARLDERRAFCIPNPNLGPQTPLTDRSLWTSKRCGLSIPPVDFSADGAPAIGECQL